MQRRDDDIRNGEEPQLGLHRVFPDHMGVVESVAEGPRYGGEAATDATDSTASSITCRAQITNLDGWKYLSCGVDSLHLGIYVQWSELWEQQKAELDEAKAKAAGTDGVLLNDGRFLVLASGKRPNYRWHLQWPDLHLFLGVSQEPAKGTPNVYASINSETLWRNGVHGAVALVVSEIEGLGGEVLSIKPSRCDLAADFLIPEGISHELLMELRVPADGSHDYKCKGPRLETFYHGAKSSPLQLRIYDKATEVLKGGTKLWFLDIWGLSKCKDVWRVEFQVRRPVLKAYRVNSIAELVEALAGLWKYLTKDWFSLRLRDDSNVSRRSVHPWWLGVQMCDTRFGPVQALLKSDEQAPASAAWFIAHCAGCLVSFAARRRVATLGEALDELSQGIKAYWDTKSFPEAYATRSIQLGFVDGSTDCSASAMEWRDVA